MNETLRRQIEARLEMLLKENSANLQKNTFHEIQELVYHTMREGPYQSFLRKQFFDAMHMLQEGLQIVKLSYLFLFLTNILFICLLH